MRVPEEIWKRTIWRICVMILFRLCFQNMLQCFLSTMKLCDFPVESMRLWNDYIKGSHFNRKGIKRMTWDMSHKISREARMEQIRFSKCIRKSSYKYSQKKKPKKNIKNFPLDFSFSFLFMRPMQKIENITEVLEQLCRLMLCNQNTILCNRFKQFCFPVCSHFYTFCWILVIRLGMPPV